MKKTILALVLNTLCVLTAKAQTTDTVFYFSDKGAHLLSPTGAYYKRVIKPASGTGKLRDVKEYYMNGQLKRIGKANPDTAGLRLGHVLWLGSYTAWYPNGQLKVKAVFDNNWPTGEITSYYPNGRIYCVERYKKENKIELITCYDTLGVVLAQNGNGHWIYYYNYDGKKVRLEGAVKNGRREGLWEGRIVDSINIISVKKFVYEFDKGKVHSSYGYDTIGQKHSFKTEMEPPRFDGDLAELIQKVRKNIKAGKPIDYDKVKAVFSVEKDGTLSNITTEGSDDATLNKT